MKKLNLINVVAVVGALSLFALGFTYVKSPIGKGDTLEKYYTAILNMPEYRYDDALDVTKSDNKSLLTAESLRRMRKLHRATVLYTADYGLPPTALEGQDLDFKSLYNKSALSYLEKDNGESSVSYYMDSPFAKLGDRVYMSRTYMYRDPSRELSSNMYDPVSPDESRADNLSRKRGGYLSIYDMWRDPYFTGVSEGYDKSLGYDIFGITQDGALVTTRVNLGRSSETFGNIMEQYINEKQ